MAISGYRLTERQFALMQKVHEARNDARAQYMAAEDRLAAAAKALEAAEENAQGVVAVLYETLRIPEDARVEFSAADRALLTEIPDAPVAPKGEVAVEGEAAALAPEGVVDVALVPEVEG